MFTRCLVLRIGLLLLMSLLPALWVYGGDCPDESKTPSCAQCKVSGANWYDLTAGLEHDIVDGIYAGEFVVDWSAWEESLITAVDLWLWAEGDREYTKYNDVHTDGGNSTESGEYTFPNIDPYTQYYVLIIFEVRDGLTERRIFLRYSDEVKAACAEEFGLTA